MKKPLLVLFDGNALIHRAFHAMPPLTVRQTGEMVSAVYGFALMLLKVINELKPTHYAIAFDMKGPTFRHELFAQYKAQRPPTPDELVAQLGRVRQLVESFHIPIFELEGFEADDLLGTLSQQASGQDIDTIIITGDADTMQLVSPRVKVLYPKPRRAFSDTTLYDFSIFSTSMVHSVTRAAKAPSAASSGATRIVTAAAGAPTESGISSTVRPS